MMNNKQGTNLKVYIYTNKEAKNTTQIVSTVFCKQGINLKVHNIKK